MEVYARFEEIEGHLFRFDTRIYLNELNSEKKSTCLGAIVGKNPGSAMPLEIGKLLKLNIDNDKMLSFVSNRFNEAYRNLKKPLPINAYIRVWNLMYVRSPDLKKAIRISESIKNLPICSTEIEPTPLIWFGWGGSNSSLDPYKERFLSRNYKNMFFYDHHSKQIKNKKPLIKDFAKHTQGMPAKPVVNFLEEVI